MFKIAFLEIGIGMIILGFIVLCILIIVIPHLIYIVSPKPLKDFFDEIAELPDFVKYILFFVFTFLIYLIFTGSGKGSEKSFFDALRETLLHKK